MNIDLFDNEHITAALYFTDQGQYLFKYKPLNSWQNRAEPGKAISKTLREREVSAAFTRKGSDSGWLQSGVIRVGVNSKGPWYVFWMKPDWGRINLFDDEMIQLPIPTTVLVGIKKEYYIFALAEDTFSPDFTVCNLPFPNVHPDGRICWGKNAAPAVNAAEAATVWKLFFESGFNGDLVSRKSKKYPHDVRTRLKLLAGKKDYPVKDLVSDGQSIGWLINRIVGREE